MAAIDDIERILATATQGEFIAYQEKMERIPPPFSTTGGNMGFDKNLPRDEFIKAALLRYGRYAEVRAAVCHALGIRSDEERQADAIADTARAAKVSAELAAKSAKKAWLSMWIALVALFASIATAVAHYLRLYLGR